LVIVSTQAAPHRVCAQPPAPEELDELAPPAPPWAAPPVPPELDVLALLDVLAVVPLDDVDAPREPPAPLPSSEQAEAQRGRRPRATNVRRRDGKGVAPYCTLKW
jgi:hypothetical protein